MSDMGTEINLEEDTGSYNDGHESFDDQPEENAGFEFPEEENPAGFAEEPTSSSAADSEEEDNPPDGLVTPPPKKRKPYREYVKELKGERARLLNDQMALQQQLAQLNEEKEKYRQYFESSTETAFKYYDETIKRDIEAAKEAQRRAIESNDVDGQAEATAKLIQATTEASQISHALSKYKAEQDTYQPQPAANNQLPPPPTYGQQQANMQNWLNSNQWFVKGSSNYNPMLAATVQPKLAEFDNNLKANNMSAWIGSPEYLDAVDKIVETEWKSQMNNQRYSNKPQNGRMVAGVRPQGNSGSSTRRNDLPPLTKGEDYIRRYFHQSPDEYRQALDDFKRGITNVRRNK